MKAEFRFHDSDRRWRVTIRGDNGEPVATSEPYFSKWNAKRYVRKFWPQVTRYETVK